VSRDIHQDAFDFGYMVAAVICSVSAMGGALVLGFQALTWLRVGTWPEMPLVKYAGVNAAAIEWIGVRHMVMWFLDLPLAGFLILGPPMFFLTLLLGAERLTDGK
jgi:hypothetical protein